MRFQLPRHKSQLALLLAALLLLANALVTAHAFGESTHVAAENCQLLHQFERQQDAPVDVAVPQFEPRVFLAPVTPQAARASDAPHACYHSRAPPASA